MRFSSVLLTATLGLLATVTAIGLDIDDIDLDDLSEVAQQCADVCSPVITAGIQCNNDFNDDNDILDCVCDANGMETSLPECEACIAPLLEGSDDFDYEDLSELRDYCGFPAASASNSSTFSNGITTIAPSGADATSTADLTVVEQNWAVATAAPIVGVGAGIAAAAACVVV